MRDSSAVIAPASDGPPARRGLTGTQITLYALSTVVALDAIGYVAAGGFESFTWLLVFAVTLAVPFALVVAELGSAFPADGGPYHWVRLAFGRATGAVAAFFYWVGTPLWIGGSLTAIVLAGTQLVSGGSGGGAVDYLLAVAFVWTVIALTAVRLELAERVAAIGGWIRIATVAVFMIAVVAYAIDRGVDAPAVGDLSPSYAGFVAAVVIMYFLFYGFETPTSIGDLDDPARDVPRGVLRAVVLAVLLYALPVLGVLLVLPTDGVTSLTGFLDAIRAVFSVFGGSVAPDGAVVLTGAGDVLGRLTGVLFVLSLVTAATAWLAASNRLQAAACRDGAGPAALGVADAEGNPVRLHLVSGVLATSVAVLSLALTSGQVAQYFSAGIALVISVQAIAYVMIFPTLLRLRRTHTAVPRPFRVGGGSAGANLAVWAVVTWSVLAIVAVIWPGLGVGWFGTAGRADDSLPDGFADQRLAYTLAQVVPLIVLAGVAATFAWLGSRRPVLPPEEPPVTSHRAPTAVAEEASVVV